MSRRSLVGSLLTLLLLLAVAYALQTLEQETEAPEREAARAARTPRPRTTAVPGQTVQLGSGSVITGGWYEIAFNAPKYPDDPAHHQGGLDERLAGLIDRATKTVDVADYDFDLMTVAEAMERAQQRGVRVRMVTDTDTVNNTRNAEIQDALKVVRDARIPIVEDKRGPIMHHKFTVVDAEWVSTGSWNYTDGDTYRLNNWMGIFHSKPLAENYAIEFEQMFGAKFGPGKAHAAKNADIRVDNERVQSCFSPPGKCDQLVVRTVLDEAKRSLKFMAFSFTHDDIGQAIIDRAKAGVKTVGVFETTGSQTQFAEFGKMKQAGLEVYTDGSPWVLHHKVIIIDDRIVVAGSFNFSANATTDNDENLLVLHSPAIAEGFSREFDTVLEVAKTKPAGQD